MQNILKLIENSGNPEYNYIIFFIIIFISPFIVSYFLKSSLIKKFHLFILLLPFTFRANSFFFIEVFSVDEYVQKLSLTTMMVYVLFLSVLIKNRKFRSYSIKSSINDIYIYMYLIFAVSAQIINHDAKAAILLILASIIPYILLFYIVVNCIKTEKDIDNTINYLVVSFLLGIFVRILTTKQFFFVQEFGAYGDYVRLGNGPFGGAASYGGYAAIMLIICLYKIQQNIDSRYFMVWVLIFILILIELLNTFTRGAVLSLASILILLKWKDQRNFFKKYIWVILILTPFLGSKLWELISYRGLYLDTRMLDIPNVATRFDLWIQGLSKIFDNFGMGVGIGIPVLFMQNIDLTNNHLYVTDNFTLQSIFGIGIYATVFFYIIMIKSMKNSYYISKTLKDKDTYSKFLFIILWSWLFFANTTSTDLYYYFPYEASMIFMILLYLASLKVSSQSMTLLNKENILVEMT